MPGAVPAPVAPLPHLLHGSSSSSRGSEGSKTHQFVSSKYLCQMFDRKLGGEGKLHVVVLHGLGAFRECMCMGVAGMGVLTNGAHGSMECIYWRATLIALLERCCNR